jgi:hypothetical protein
VATPAGTTPPATTASPGPLTRAPATPHPAATPAKSATLRIAGHLPDGAAVLVDGRPAHGRTLTLPPGAHSVSVVATGFVAASWTGSLAAGESHTWTARLVPAGTPAHAAPAPPPAATEAAAPSRASPVQSGGASPYGAAPQYGASPSAGSGYPAAPAPTSPAPPPTPAVAQPAPTEDAGDRVAAAVLPGRARAAAASLAAAIAARDLAALHRAWPGVRPVEERSWDVFLVNADNTSIDARVADVRPPQVEGNTATVGFSIAVGFKNHNVGHRSATSHFNAVFSRAGNDWTLAAIHADQ